MKQALVIVLVFFLLLSGFGLINIGIQSVVSTVTGNMAVSTSNYDCFVYNGPYTIVSDGYYAVKGSEYDYTGCYIKSTLTASGLVFLVEDSHYSNPTRTCRHSATAGYVYENTAVCFAKDGGDSETYYNEVFPAYYSGEPISAGYTIRPTIPASSQPQGSIVSLIDVINNFFYNILRFLGVAI
jgi:hypothetical protein